MRMLIVLPQRQHRPVAINSVDLYAQALLERSCHRDYRVLTHKSGLEFFGRDKVTSIPRVIENHALPTATFAAVVVRGLKPDIAIVHQRFQVAVALRRFCPGLPIVYNSHSFHKGYAASEGPRRARRSRELAGLSGMIHVSEACAADFVSKWPEIDIPQAVIPNGLDFAEWRPSPERAHEIVCVGRAIPEKGMLEAAIATNAVLSSAPRWTARFVISEARRQKAYAEKIVRALQSPLTEGRALIEYDLAWPDVQSRLQRAAIALVPSLWREPFGRTALEAHAAGAAVISSGSGGLREISDEYALYADPRDPGALASALKKLMSNDVLRRTIAASGRSRVESRFHIASLAKQADEFYSACLA